MYSFSGQELERSEEGGISIEAVDFEDPTEEEVLQYRFGCLSTDGGKPQIDDMSTWSTSSIINNLNLPSGMASLQTEHAVAADCLSCSRLFRLRSVLNQFVVNFSAFRLRTSHVQ